MTVILGWLENVLFVYMLLGTFNLITGLGIAVIPWWLWGLVSVFATVGNSVLLGRKRISLLSFFALNGLLVLSFGVLPVILYQRWAMGGMWTWTYFVPVFLEVLLEWAFFVYFLTNPPAPRQRVLFLEVGLVFAVICLSLLQKSAYSLPYSNLAAGGFIFSGLLGEAVLNSGTTAKTSNVKVRLGLPAVATLGLTGAGLAAGFLVASNVFRDFISYVMAFVLKILQKMTDMLGYNRLPEQPKQKLLLPGYHLVQSDHLGNSTAPLWLMIILWTILGILVLMLIIVLIIYCVRFISELRSLDFTWSRQRGPRIDSRIDRQAIKRMLLSIYERLRFKIKERLKWVFHISPANTLELYAYYLFWGKKMRLERLPGETAKEYFARLSPVLQSEHPHLLDSLGLLTESYDHLRYGGEETQLSPAMIVRIFRELKAAKRKRS